MSSPCQPGDRCWLTSPFQELQQEGDRPQKGAGTLGRDDSCTNKPGAARPDPRGVRGVGPQRPSSEAGGWEASPLQAGVLHTPWQRVATGKPEGQDESRS